MRQLAATPLAHRGRFVLLVLALGAALLAGACRDVGESEGQGAALADRLLRLGEDADAKLEVREGEMPAGLREALNPGATPDTPQSDLVSLPVHPSGKLLGSMRLERPDGTLTFFLIYDVPGKPADIEGQVAQQVNATPWQTVGGQSNDSISALRFQSTISGDVTGTVAMQGAPSATDADPVTSLVYIIEVEPATPPDAQPFTLPPARAIPEGFPPDFVLQGMTPIEVQWAAAPQGRTYQLILLTRQSSLDVTQGYRDAFQRNGWELVSDEAQGFATQLSFEKDTGTSQASLSIDAYSEDDSYTAVFFSLSLAR